MLGEALGVCEEFVGNDKCVVILGDNIFEDDILSYVEQFKNQGKGAKILIKKVKDPERYGIVQFNGNSIVEIEEKPKNPKSNYCVTGIYMYGNIVFEIIKKLTPSARGELEITYVNYWYILNDILVYDILKG